MKYLPYSVLILSYAVVVASAEPQALSFETCNTVSKLYYTQVQQAAEAEKKAGERSSRAIWLEVAPTPKMATGLVVNRQGQAIPGARVVIEREASDEVLGEGATDSAGKFQITLSQQSYRGLTLTVTSDRFARYSLGGIYGGIVDYRVRLDREIDEGFWKTLNAEHDEQKRLWMLLEVIGDRQCSTETTDVFSHIGTLRSELLHVVRSRAFAAQDGRHASPAERVCGLLAYWCNPADEPVYGEWLKNQKTIEQPKDKRYIGKTIPEVCKQWADHHFSGKKPEDRTFHVFNDPLLDLTGSHALVEFWVEYKHWGYSQLLILTKQQDQWQLEFVADQCHWEKALEAQDN